MHFCVVAAAPAAETLAIGLLWGGSGDLTLVCPYQAVEYYLQDS